MVPDRQKVWTDGRNGRADDAKTISLRLCRGIIMVCFWVLACAYKPTDNSRCPMREGVQVEPTISPLVSVGILFLPFL